MTRSHTTQARRGRRSKVRTVRRDEFDAAYLGFPTKQAEPICPGSPTRTSFGSSPAPRPHRSGVNEAAQSGSKGEHDPGRTT